MAPESDPPTQRKPRTKEAMTAGGDGAGGDGAGGDGAGGLDAVGDDDLTVVPPARGQLATIELPTDDAARTTRRAVPDVIASLETAPRTARRGVPDAIASLEDDATRTAKRGVPDAIASLEDDATRTAKRGVPDAIASLDEISDDDEEEPVPAAVRPLGALAVEGGMGLALSYDDAEPSGGFSDDEHTPTEQFLLPELDGIPQTLSVAAAHALHARLGAQVEVLLFGQASRRWPDSPQSLSPDSSWSPVTVAALDPNMLGTRDLPFDEPFEDEPSTAPEDDTTRPPALPFAEQSAAAPVTSEFRAVDAEPLPFVPGVAVPPARTPQSLRVDRLRGATMDLPAVDDSLLADGEAVLAHDPLAQHTGRPSPPSPTATPTVDAEAPISLETYARIKAAVWTRKRSLTLVLESEAVDELTWRKQECAHHELLAEEAQRGDSEFAQQLRDAFRAARGEDEVDDDAMPLVHYAMIRAELQVAPQSTHPRVLASHSLDADAWQRVVAHWTKLARADRQVAKEIRRHVARARKQLQDALEKS